LGLRVDGKTVRDYYYHGVSHNLGLDTHDISTERERTLKPGSVITVEPGLYIEDEAIGIRIENDILITEEGCIDLSVEIPVTVEQIEALMAK
jgi:Xaa-Pro aminopeptidase